MQLETIRKQINGVVRFVVLKDGVHVADFGTVSLAFQYQDQLFAGRPESDKVLEHLYSGR